MLPSPFETEFGSWKISQSEKLSLLFLVGEHLQEVEVLYSLSRLQGEHFSLSVVYQLPTNFNQHFSIYKKRTICKIFTSI